MKTDKREARTLAEACRLGAYRPAHRTSDRQRHVRAQLAVRETMVRTRSATTIRPGRPPSIYLEGNGLRRIGRLLGVNHQTVANWVNYAHARLQPEPAGPNTPEAVGALEMDELFNCRE